jgi:branched-chain amino acid transport system permease protein
LGDTVAALLIILMGGIGTLSGAIIGAAVYRLLEFYLDRWFGEYASFLLGLVYVGLVMFLPFGIVGTWQSKQFQIQKGRARLLKLLGPQKETA